MQSMPGVAACDDVRALECLRRAALVARPGIKLERRVLDAIPPSARFVLIGEASHGTEEFYRMRSKITKSLIEERGFHGVAVEADFPDAFRANMWVRGLGEDATAEESLHDFIRFPQWMWRNTAVRDFLTWLRMHNETQPGGTGAAAARVGFYGMDLYSLHSSAKHVVKFLETVDPPAAERAAARYRCFDKYGESATAYGMATAISHKASCAYEAIAALREVLQHNARHAEVSDGEVGQEMAFQAAANAAVVAGAEEYYRSMFFGDELTWNLRDSHFADTVSRIARHLERRLDREHASGDGEAKLVIWAHNSHVGDARATDMGQHRGEHNLGQLMRQQYGEEEVYSVGFTTHTGTVAAADEWDAPGQKKAVRKSMPGSYENLFHRVELPEFALSLRDADCQLREILQGPMLERAIGVIYRPRTERASHYFYARLTQQFDLVIHVDQTEAVRPLEPSHPSWEEEHIAKEDLPETYPFAL